MKILKEFLEWIRELYEDGLHMINESWSQIAHVSIILGTMAWLWAVDTKTTAMFWSIILVVYMCLLGVCGFLKFDILDDNPICFLLYISGSIGLAIAGGIYTGFLKTVLIVGIIAVLTVVFWKAGEPLNGITLSLDGKKPFFERLYNKNEEAYILIYCICIAEMFFIPLMIFLKVSFLLKIIMMALYFLSIPIISVLADEGIDIENMWE